MTVAQRGFMGLKRFPYKAKAKFNFGVEDKDDGSFYSFLQKPYQISTTVQYICTKSQ